ncbi:MAG: hypothetical protein M3Q65_00465 [Chloroflexota bacterium]|nr:hypothetical protein [Chloroflexota bacterium]
MKLDNLALVPASLLPFKERWQQLMAELPAGDVLMILPAGTDQLRGILHTLAPALRARGRRVTTISTSQLP